MKSLRFTLLILTVFAGSSCLHAATLSWDPSFSTGSALGGTGNWDQVSNVWYNGVSDVAWININGDDAVFNGSNGIATLTENITAGNLFFTNTTGAYTLTNATGAETLSLTGGTIDTGGGDHVISVPLGGSAQITKSGAGRAHFTADSTLSYTGSAFLVTNGIVSMENSNGLAASGTSVVVANGAGLEFNNAVAVTNVSPITISGAGPAGKGVIDNIAGGNFSQGTVTLAGDTTLGEDGGTLEFDGGLNGNGSDMNLTAVGTSTNTMKLTAGGINLGNGTLTVNSAGTFQINQSAAYTATYSNLVVTSGFFQLGGQELNLGTVPGSLVTNQIYLNGGGLSSSTSSFVLSLNRGITIGPNGGSITIITGNMTTCGIYSDNVPVTFNCTGGNATDLTLGAPISIGTAGYTKNGPMTMNLNGKVNIVGSITVNQGNLSWGTSTTPLGPVPGSYVSNWLTLNGGNILPSNSQTVEANRGVFLGASGGGIGENTANGNLTIAGIITGPGNLTKLTGGNGSSVVLTASNTFTGKVTVQGNNIKIGAGGSTGTLGNGNSVVLSAATSGLNFNRNDTNYSYGGVVSGAGTVTNLGSGTITLTGANTYTGGTSINAGKLMINNATGSGTGTGSVLVLNNAALGGTGAISGAVTVNAGGTITPGTAASPLGTLTINNNLSIAGNVGIFVNKSLSPSNNEVVVTGTLANSGTGKVTVSNLGPALVAGDTFQIFSQAVSGGNNLQITGGGVLWSNNLALNGTISAVPFPHPTITTVSLSGTNLVLAGTNGYSGGGYYVLTSTNVTNHLNTWTRLLTNSFDTNGNFSVTNSSSTTNTAGFYVIQLQ